MGSSGLEFNIQEELRQMREERKEDHRDLSAKIESGFDSLERWARNHELQDQEMFLGMANRLEPLEAIHGTIKKATKWIVMALLSPVIYAVVTEHVLPALRHLVH